MAHGARKIMIHVLEFLLLLVVAFVFLFSYQRAHDRQAREQIAVIIEKLEAYRRDSGTYPKCLEDLDEANVWRKKIWFVFPAPRVNYRVQDDGYKIVYYGFPLGPYHGYNSKDDEWYFAE